MYIDRCFIDIDPSRSWIYNIHFLKFFLQFAPKIRILTYHLLYTCLDLVGDIGGNVGLFVQLSFKINAAALFIFTWIFKRMNRNISENANGINDGQEMANLKRTDDTNEDS